MKHLIIIALTGLIYTTAMGQPLPDCIQKIRNDTTKKTFGNRKFAGTLVLSNKERLYKMQLIRPPRCMDCNSGIIYVDSLCRTVASFTVGNSFQASARPGYNIYDFPEAGSGVYKDVVARQANRISYNFTTPVKFGITEIPDKQFDLFEKKDSLLFSNSNGLSHYENGILKNTYKIIPYKIKHADTLKAAVMVYYFDPLKKFVYVKDGNDGSELYCSKLKYEQQSLKVFDPAGWQLSLLLRKQYSR